MTKVLVTGSNGFVGKALCEALEGSEWHVRKALRNESPLIAGAAVDCITVGEIGPATDWKQALDGIDTLVHLAARVHVMKEKSKNPLDEFRKVNVYGTERLARMASENGVKRLIFISTVKVHGEVSIKPFTEEDVSRPEDDYAVSKWEAEQKLREIATETGMDIVVIRPPLVYGPGVKGNFLRMLKWVDAGVFLPLRKIENRRSLVSLENFVDLILHCVNYPSPCGGTYLVSDGTDLSTPELIRGIADAMGKGDRLFSVPEPILAACARLFHFNREYERLTGSLQVDIQYASQSLEWTPPYSVKSGIKNTVKWYRGGSHS